MLKKPSNLKINVKLPVVYKYKNMDNRKFPTNNNSPYHNNNIIVHRESVEKRKSLKENYSNNT